MALWEGRFKKELDKQANDFNASIFFDKRLDQRSGQGGIHDLSNKA